MRKHIILLYLIILSASCFAQTVTKTVGIVYTAGAPAHAPAAKVGSQVAIDTATWEWYEYNGSAWIASGDRIQSISGCSAPNYTPTKYQSRLVINACTAGQGGPELYYWTGSVWLQINETYTAGTGISIVGSTITNTGDLSTTNEIQTLSIAGSNLSLSNGGGTVALPATGITSLGGQTGGTQTFATGTSGTDFAISSFSNTHTLNLPTASASNRGAVSSADWSTFNSKIGGSGTAGQVAYFNGAGTLSSSAGFLWDDVSKRLSIGASSGNASSLEIVTTKSGITSTITPTASVGMFLGQSIDINTTGLTGSAGYTGLSINRTGTAPSGSSFYFRFQNNSSDVYTANSVGEVAHIPSGLSGFSSYQYNGVNTSAQFGYFRATNAQTGVSLRNALVTDNGTGVGFRFSVTTNSAYTPVSNTAAKVLVVGNGQSPATDVAYVRASGETYIGGNVGVLTTSPTSATDITGANGYSQLRLRTTYTPTSTADALGNVGDVAHDANYIYIKTSGGWKRSALSTF